VTTRARSSASGAPERVGRPSTLHPDDDFGEEPGAADASALVPPSTPAVPMHFPDVTSQ